MPSPQRPRLVSLSYSPWSEKAHWALEHHGIVYDRIAFRPLLDETALRLRTGKLRGPLTVPVLHDSERWWLDSWDIARWADRVGSGSKLFPADALDAVTHFNALSEQGLAAGRALGLMRMLEQPRWLLAMVPTGLQRPLGRLAPRLAKVAALRTLQKYGAHRSTPAQHRQRLGSVLSSLRARVQSRPRNDDGVQTLLDAFSYADIAMAQVLQFVEPRNVGHFKLGPEGQKGYRDAALASEFGDLCEWRDALYAAYHPRQRSQPR